jgi:hypothetical protein
VARLTTPASANPCSPSPALNHLMHEATTIQGSCSMLFFSSRICRRCCPYDAPKSEHTDTQPPIYTTLNHISSQGLETTEIVYDRKVPFILPSVTETANPRQCASDKERGIAGFGLGSAVPIAQITRSSWLASWNCQRASSCSQAETYIDISLN